MSDIIPERKIPTTGQEMERYNIEILVLSEVRWNTQGWPSYHIDTPSCIQATPCKDDFYDNGVRFMLTKKAARASLEWNPVSLRINLARFETKFKKTTIIQVYANNPDEDEKEDF